MTPLATAIAAVEVLRSEATKDPRTAIAKSAKLGALGAFDNLSSAIWVNTPAQTGWAQFFKSSIYTMVLGSDSSFLAMFDQPYSDVVLITLWETKGGRDWLLSDLELVPGDFIRKGGRPPYSLQPGWLGQKKLPAISIEETLQQTIDAFASAFPSKPSKLPALKSWRWVYAVPGDLAAPKAAHQAAGFALEWNNQALAAFLRDKALMAPIDEAFAKVRAGKIEEVLRAAKDTPPEVADVLKKIPQIWTRLHFASCTAGTDYRTAIFDTVPPENIVTFTLRPQKKGNPVLARIDLVNHRLYRGYLAAENKPAATPNSK